MTGPKTDGGRVQVQQLRVQDAANTRRSARHEPYHKIGSQVRQCDSGWNV